MIRRVRLYGLSLSTSLARPQTSMSSSTVARDIDAKRYVCCVCGKDFPSPEILRSHYNFRHTKAIFDLLRKDPAKTYTRIFDKEVRRRNSCELRFGNGLVVNIRKYPPDMTPCPQFGLWYDFVEGVGGGPLSAIQKARNVGYLEAVEIGAEITGLSMSELAAHVPDPKLVDHHGRERTKMSGRFGQSTSDDSRLAEARRIWASSIALPGTLASEYLVKHRKIDPGVIERLHFGFLPKYPFISDLEELQSNEEYGGKPIMGPALLVPVRNSDWHLTGVQRIFLNEDTAGKPKGQHKFSKGHLKGNAGIVQRGGGSGSIVYVVEGPETGASVACAVNPDATIVATLSLGNLANIGNFVRSLKPLKVVLALDHDVKEAAKNAMERATSVLAKELEKDDISWERRLPELTARGSALDWNDILVTQGLDELKRQLGT